MEEYRMRLTAVVILALAASLAPAAAQSSKDATKIRVLVTTLAERDGFTDPDFKARNDSANDIAKILRGKKKDFVIVGSELEADLWLEILSRGTTQAPESQTTTVFNPATNRARSRSQALYESVLIVRLTAGDYSTELRSSSGTGSLAPWSIAAGGITHQVEKWVKDNRARLIERRNQK